MTPIWDRWLEYERNLPENLNPKARRTLEWAFYVGAAAAFTELRPRASAECDRETRRTIRHELDQYAAQFQKEVPE